jgi:hypothetical protein
VISGVSTIIPFSVAVRYLFPILGIWLGTVLSYEIAVPFAIASYRLSNPGKDSKVEGVVL